jgi:septal ring factor EnvC (AmiA/AmiB activator)
MRSSGATSTLKLATARLEFSSNRRLAHALHLTAVAALVALVVMIGRQLHAETRATDGLVDGLERQNSSLRADLERTRIELELERSTRAALTRQVAELTEQKSELEARLDFFNAQSGRTARSR